MAKFYIQTGELSYIVSAQDSQGAALWVLHQAIQRCEREHGWQLDDWQEADALPVELTDRLDMHVDVSQLGFGRHEAGRFETQELYDVWRSLYFSMLFLFDQMG